MYVDRSGAGSVEPAKTVFMGTGCGRTAAAGATFNGIRLSRMIIGALMTALTCSAPMMGLFGPAFGATNTVVHGFVHYALPQVLTELLSRL